MTDLQPTPQLLRNITAFIRAGSFPRVAAEASGVPGETYDRWMEQREFREAIHQARALARVSVETEVRKSKPLDWLRYGPGKPGEVEGWTAAARPTPSKPMRPSEGLEQAQTQTLIARVLKVLEGHPEVREEVARSLDDPSPPASRPGA